MRRVDDLIEACGEQLARADREPAWIGTERWIGTHAGRRIVVIPGKPIPWQQVEHIPEHVRRLATDVPRHDGDKETRELHDRAGRGGGRLLPLRRAKVA
jgi:hypothetical protein